MTQSGVVYAFTVGILGASCPKDDPYVVVGPSRSLLLNMSIGSLTHVRLTPGVEVH